MDYKRVKNKELRALTSGNKTFGAQWLFQHSATHQSMVTVDTNVARSPKRFYTAGRYGQGQRNTYNQKQLDYEKD